MGIFACCFQAQPTLHARNLKTELYNEINYYYYYYYHDYCYYYYYYYYYYYNNDDNDNKCDEDDDNDDDDDNNNFTIGLFIIILVKICDEF